MKSHHNNAAAEGRSAISGSDSPWPVTRGQAKAAIEISIKLMEEDMDQYFYAAKKLDESGMLKESVESKRKALGRKAQLHVLKLMLDELLNKEGHRNSPAFIQNASNPASGTTPQ